MDRKTSVNSQIAESGENSYNLCEAGIGSCSTCFINGDCTRQEAGAIGVMEKERCDIDIEERLKTEQHCQLRGLRDKLEDMLGCEPTDSGDEEENRIWARANDLKVLLDNFLEEQL